MQNKNPIEIFYSCDERFLRYTVVSLHSLIKNSSKSRKYRIHVLHTDISETAQRSVLDLATDSVGITFDNVTPYLEQLTANLPIRDYYSKSTYYRLFIADMYPEIDKALYIDSDTVVTGDISELYDTDIEDYYAAGCREQAMVQEDVYGTYVEKCLGLDRYAYFNAGVLLINCRLFRENKMLDRFGVLLSTYDCRVTQDEDYLNIMFKDHVLFLPQYWNMEVFGTMEYPPEECKIIHYIMVSKPWHYADCRLGDIFWKYAKETAVYDEIRHELESYTDQERERDAESLKRLASLARDESNRPDTYVARMRAAGASDRAEALRKIEKLEREGRFDEDVEEDPPTRPIKEGEVDFFRKSLKARFKARYAYFIARRFLNKQIKEKNIIIKDVIGVENLQKLDTGAVITCNHFNPFDSFAMQVAYERAGFNSNKKPRLYRVIREGNYTSFPGFYGFLMRHFHTLPLASSKSVLREFSAATEQLLREGNFVLVYPEQSMWWNYRKPKPLKSGAFRFASRAKVPVVPCFIIQRDSNHIGNDGYPVQEYTIHVSAPIYPDPTLSDRENAERLMEENSRVWREIYEEEYGTPLRYL